MGSRNSESCRSNFGGIVLIAPWFTLQDLESDEEWNIAKPWLETNISFAGAAKHISKITAIFSDNDPVVPLENAELFKQKFGTDTIVENDKGHFTEEDGVSELPSALNAILEIK